MASTKIPLAGVLSILSASLTMISVTAQSQQPAQPSFGYDSDEPTRPMMPYDNDFGRMMMPYDYSPGYGPEITNPNAMLGPYRTGDHNAYSFADGTPLSRFEDVSPQMPPPSSNDADVIPRRPSSDPALNAPDATSPPTNTVPSTNPDREDNSNALLNPPPTADGDMSDSFPFDSMDPFDFGLDEADEADIRQELGMNPFQENEPESQLGPAPTPAPGANLRVSQESDDEGERTTRRRRQTFVTVTATVTVTIRETPTLMVMSSPTNAPIAAPTELPVMNATPAPAPMATPTPAAGPTATSIAPTGTRTASPTPNIQAMPADAPAPTPMAEPPIVDTTIPIPNDSNSETTDLDRNTAVEPSPEALPDSTTDESPINSDDNTIDSPHLNNSTTTDTDSPTTEEELNGEVTPYSTDESNSNTNSTEGGDSSSPSDNSTDLSLPNAGNNGTASKNGTESGNTDGFRNGTSSTNTTRNDSSTGNGTDGRLESGAVQAGLLREFVHTAGIGLAVAVVLFGAL
ncbi:hypothetical protein HK102_009804 [Quaeritorhiza haematococci]|nr:hypothetical protein HK102_009804 [Quaeritorhiza haematococci]